MFERKRMNGGREGVVGWRDGEGGCDVDPQLKQQP